MADANKLISSFSSMSTHKISNVTSRAKALLVKLIPRNRKQIQAHAQQWCFVRRKKPEPANVNCAFMAEFNSRKMLQLLMHMQACTHRHVLLRKILKYSKHLLLTSDYRMHIKFETLNYCYVFGSRNSQSVCSVLGDMDRDCYK